MQHFFVPLLFCGLIVILSAQIFAKYIKMICMMTVFFCGMSMLYVPSARAFEGSVGLNAGIDYFSNYFWRGDDLYGENRGVFFPFVNQNAADTGVSIGYIGEYASEVFGDGANDIEKLCYVADFGICFTRTFAETVTVGVEVWYFWYYNSADRNKKVNGNNHNESYFTGTLSLTIDVLPLSPAIIYNHDYYVDDYEGTREVDRDFYLQFQLNRDFKLTDEATLTLLGGLGYYNNKAAEIEGDPATRARKGISDVTASADLCVTVGQSTFHGSINYAYVPDKDWNRYYSTKANKHRWWSGFGASYSL